MTELKSSMIRWVGAALVALPMLASAGDAANGEKLVADKGCAACHGADGNSATPTFPILAGQYEDYLVQALKQYQSGARQNPIMGGSAAGLTEQEIADLAAWFASNESALQYVK